MPLNIPGTLVPLHLLFSPRLVLPSLAVRDIRQLDFVELRKAGYKGAVFDKDNCLTLPHRDRLVPELTDAWKECRETFGEGNVLIVSNSAGTRLDVGEIQAESVTHHLNAPVLRHKVFKPSYSCISSIRAYFASLPQKIRDEELIVVGDRIFTDVVMANRMARKQAVPSNGTPQDIPASEKSQQTTASSKQERAGPLSIWTTGVWEREGMPMRFLEKSFMEAIRRHVVAENGVRPLGGDVSKFVKPEPAKETTPTPRPGLVSRIWQRIRR